MALTNQSKPSTSISNATKVLGGETWDSNPNTWNVETRTWDESGTLWTNGTRPITSITNNNKPS
jgi:hypothetical protein